MKSETPKRSPVRKGLSKKRGRRGVGEKQSSREILDQVAELMAVPVTRCSRDLKYVWANPAYAQFLQRPLGEIVGRPIVDVLGRELFEKLRPNFERVRGLTTSESRMSQASV